MKFLYFVVDIEEIEPLPKYMFNLHYYQIGMFNLIKPNKTLKIENFESKYIPEIIDAY